MPLESLAFTGCEIGHDPSAPGSAVGPAGVGAGVGAGTSCVGRGIGGNGNGAVSHVMSRLGSGTRRRHARHAEYARPATSPAPNTRLDPLRIGEFSHADRRSAEVTLTHRRVTGRLKRLMYLEATPGNLQPSALLGLLLT